MRRLLLIFGFLLTGLLAPRVSAQTPNCQININPQTDVYTSPYFDNRVTQCTYWVLNYQVTGFSAISIEVDSATGATAPGTFAAFSGTVTTGVNPSTSVACSTVSNCTIVLTGAVGWYRVAFTSHTGSGSIQGTLQGYKTGVSLGGNAPGGGCPSPCPVTGVVAVGSPPTVPPLPVAGFDGTNLRAVSTDTAGRTVAVGPAANGTAIVGNPMLVAFWDGINVRTPVYCSNRAAISTSASAVIVAGVAAKKTYVCQIQMSNAAAVDIQIKSGTGAACATGTTNLTGNFKQILTAVMPFESFAPLTTAAAADDLCLTLGAAVDVEGVILYAQF